MISAGRRDALSCAPSRSSTRSNFHVVSVFRRLATKRRGRARESQKLRNAGRCTCVLLDTMLGDDNSRRYALDRRSYDGVHRVIVDREGRLPEQALALRRHLAALAEERLLAREVGLSTDRVYIEDLEFEAAETQFVYDGAVVLQLASLRAEFDGRGQG
jgi:hypothetical protein